ncbi:hypothetical protein GLS40_13985 [Pseudooceanicola sp. 216_PA32_1]|uniref:Solute-binding protein family 5 domain-containing protein n=1 Tax=Pseudooceanicola pacificus TaxID=2676438 RepID=A0A844W4I0_9RHOB|nr:ABC transporter substrate-binding protein [Pseudooceanicola pacificus]MWB79146.1 hypothetical protein [Pseudooceanicola pacificus]
MAIFKFPKQAAHLAMAAAVAFGASAAQPAFADDILTVGNPFPPFSLDPALSGNGRAGTWLLPTYEPLVRTKADGSFEPALATSWQVSDDALSVTFTLRTDAKFSNGEPVNAEAVKKSVEYFVNKKGPFYVNLASMTSVEVLAPDQVKISLSEPNPAIVSLFDQNWNAGAIICPAMIDTPDVLLTESCGAGPYVLDSANSISGKTYVYTPSETYYDQSKIYWDGIKISVFQDQNSGVQALKANQLKLLISDPFTGHSNRAAVGDSLRLVTSPLQWAGLVLTDRIGEVNPALADIRVRKALNMGIDRDLVAKAMFGDLAYGTDQIQAKGFVGYDPALEEMYPFDVEKAKALLAEAGYGDGLRVKATYVTSTLNDALFQAYAGQLSQIGVTLFADPKTGFAGLRQANKDRTYETLLFNTNSGIPDLAKFQTLSPTGSLNAYATTDDELTALIDKASATVEPDARKAAWEAVYRRVTELAWFLPVLGIDATYFATSDIETPEIGQSVIIDLAWVKPANK